MRPRRARTGMLASARCGVPLASAAPSSGGPTERGGRREMRDAGTQRRSLLRGMLAAPTAVPVIRTADSDNSSRPASRKAGFGQARKPRFEHRAGIPVFSWLSAKNNSSTRRYAAPLKHRRAFASKTRKSRFKWRSTDARAAQKPGFCSAKPRFRAKITQSHFQLVFLA